MLCSLVDDTFVESLVRVRTLGRGYYSTVELMETKDGREKYAVKRQRLTRKPFDIGLSQSSLADSDTLIRFKDVPNIIKLIGVCYAEKEFYIIMEAMDCNLREYYQRLSLEDRVKLAPHLLYSIVLPVSIMGAMNMVHFDVKPDNILVRDDKFALSDFDISKLAIPGIYVPPGQAYTFGYCPPEFVVERARDSFDLFKGDIWAIGLTVTEFILGEQVIPTNGFTKDSLLNSLYKISRTPVEKESFEDKIYSGQIKGYIDLPSIFLNSGIQTSLTSVLTRMLSLNPDDRPSANEILVSFKEQINPVFLSTLFPPVLPRKLSEEQYNFFLRMAKHMRLKRIAKLIALEILTRFLGLTKDEPGNVHILVCLRLADNFVSYIPMPIVNVLRAQRSYIIPSDYLEAERQVLQKIGFYTFNPNLFPAIRKMCKEKISLKRIPYYTFTKPVWEWFLQQY